MHGLILLTALAALGVDWDWRELEDKQIEYMLLVEPKNLQLLSQGGDPLRSSLPNDVARVDRLMIRIGARFPGGGTRIPADTFLRADMRAAGDEYPQAVVFQNNQAAASPEVKFGWRAGLDPQQVDFLVQISPTLLATLRDGDELYVPVPPAAGKVTQFVISTGVQELPRVGAAQNRFGPEPNPRFASSQPTRITSDPPNDFRAPPGGFSTPPSTLSPAPNNSFGPAPNNSFGPAPNPSFGPVPGASFGPAPPGSNPAPLNSGPTAFAADPSTRRNSFGTGEAAQTQFAAQPTNNNFTASLPPGDRPAQQPPSSNNLFPSNNNPSTYTPNSGPGAPTGNQPFASGPPANQPPPTDNRFNSPTTASFPPAGGGANAPAGQFAARPTTSPNASFQQPPTNNFAPPPAGYQPLGGGTMNTNGNTPYYPGVWTAIFLMFSLAANFWTGWTAWEYYSRYRLAVERLRSSSAPRA